MHAPKFYVCLAAVTVFTAACVSTTKPIAADVYPLVKAREQVSGYVIQIKRKYKEGDEQYGAAEKLYDTARSSYAGWVAVVKLGIIQGTSKDLRGDSEYKQIASECGSASQNFVDYAEKASVQSKGLFTFATDVARIGIMVWNDWRDHEAKARADFAKSFAEEVSWKSWNDIR